MPVTEKFVRLYNEFTRPTTTFRSSSTPTTSSTSSHHHHHHHNHPSSSSSSSSTTLLSIVPGNPPTITTTRDNNNNNTSTKQYAQTAPPLLPEFFFDVLQPFSERTGIPYKDGDKVNQQDAQEFLTYILDRMHEEFLLVHNSSTSNKQSQSSSSSSSNGDEGWEEVGKKNKSAVVLTKDTYAQSIISHTFGGKQRSSVRKHGQGGQQGSSKASVTIQPFYCLHLDIDKPNIKTLEDAIDAYMEPEKLEGYTDDTRGVEVQASKQTTIEALPRVLIIHLKRFAYDSSQARKLDKYVSFPAKLTLKKHFLSNDKVAPDPKKREYTLCSVVEHHGKVAVKGHYTCDINTSILSKAGGPPEWLNFDDQIVRRVTPKDVQLRLAYLLFYVQN